jgi:hypothetical protein
MKLEDSARLLCHSDQSCSPYLRAVELFGLQVAILSPDAPHLELMARALAALKILERLEVDTEANANLEQRLGIAGYREVLDLIMREGGAKQLRSLWGTTDFWKDTSVRISEARDVARMVRFSHRFAEFGPTIGRKLGGSTMARYFVCEMNGKSDGTLRARWREYGERAVLQYLLLYYFTELKPCQLSRKNFATRLLEQAEDILRLRSFFSTYVDLARILKPRGYKFDDFKFDSFGVEKIAFDLQPFSALELEAIKRYKS